MGLSEFEDGFPFGSPVYNERRTYGLNGLGSSGCYQGFYYDRCSIEQQFGNGTVSIAEEDPENCTCTISVFDYGPELDGDYYTVAIATHGGCY